jgi:HSP20 family molecular chaperone IbpA
MTTETKKLTCNDEVVILPPVDIFETDDAFILKCEMPAVSKEQVEVLLDKNELTIRGNVSENADAYGTLVYSEYSLCNYERTFRVGNNINGAAINASLDNGILTVTLPKSETIKPRKIEVSFEK